MGMSNSSSRRFYSLRMRHVDESTDLASRAPLPPRDSSFLFFAFCFVLSSVRTTNVVNNNNLYTFVGDSAGGQGKRPPDQGRVGCNYTCFNFSRSTSSLARSFRRALHSSTLGLLRPPACPGKKRKKSRAYLSLSWPLPLHSPVFSPPSQGEGRGCRCRKGEERLLPSSGSTRLALLYRY